MAELLADPTREQLLRFCAEAPIERVFIEDLAREGLGQFAALADGERLTAVCHVGANIVPAGEGCGAFAELTRGSGARMIVSKERAVDELWRAARRLLPEPREDRPAQPVYTIDQQPDAGSTGLRQAALSDFDLLLPACAAAHAGELGVDPLRDDPGVFRRRVRRQIERGRSWLWERDGTILFKAEASAWTPSAVQLQQVWVDPPARNRGYAGRGMRDLSRLLLEQVSAVCLFVRAENAPAISLYEVIGMRRVGTYRSILF